MTCIVGIVDQDTIYMGADSAGVAGYLTIPRKDSKIFISKNKNAQSFLIGFTSSFRMGQILQYNFQPPEYFLDISLEEYMVTKFVETARECFRQGGYTSINNNVESGGQFLVGFKNRLFTIDSDFQVGESYDDYSAIGCGEELALGSLYSTFTKDPCTRLRLALESAAKFNGAVSAPFNYLHLT